MISSVIMAAVLVTNVTWHDAARHREVPARIYAPDKVTKPAPLIIFSHGLGGTRYGYAYLGQHWAAHGYVAVHVQHAGSDGNIFNANETLLASARRAVAQPENWRERPADVSFAITQMLHDPRVDPKAIGVAGHSFGAHTTLEIIGLRVAGEDFHDPRVKAAVAMSSPKPLLPGALKNVKTPCLHLTGTKDDSPVFPTKPEDRRFVYDHINAPQQWLVTLKDAHHFSFSDNPRWEAKAVERDPRHHKWIGEMTTKFWDAFLRGDAKARAWWDGSGLKELLGDDATVEKK